MDGEDVFWTAGLFPEEGMYICKRNAADGTGGWTSKAKLPPQGYLLATSRLLFVPTGKTHPIVYNRSDGSYLSKVSKKTYDGGSWALITPDESQLWYGATADNKATVFATDVPLKSKQNFAHIAYVGGANYLIADSSYSYYNTDLKIVKISRADRAVVWDINAAYPYALIKAGKTVFAGGDGKVAAFNSSDGSCLWTADTDGKVYGLAVAKGRLYVSTDKGSIYCFAVTKP